MNSLPPTLHQPSKGPAGALRGHRCVRHETREAVARCPDCGGSYCRECVVDHAGRLLCAACLAKAAAAAAALTRPRRDFGAFGRAVSLGAAALALWLAFHLIGDILVRIPADVHDATFWAPARERVPQRR